METNTTQSVISKDNYEEISKMLTCNDDASINLALSILEQSNFEESEVYILCLLKSHYNKIFGSNTNTTRFETSYPDLFTKINTRLRDQATDISILSFRKIFEITKERGNVEELTFMLNILRDDLVSLLEEFGFEFIKDLELQFKPIGMPDAKDLEIEKLKAELEKYKKEEHAKTSDA